MGILQDRDGAAAIGRLSPPLQKLYDAYKPSAELKPTPQQDDTEHLMLTDFHPELSQNG